jgi:hypothetical protein
VHTQELGAAGGDQGEVRAGKGKHMVEMGEEPRPPNNDAQRMSKIRVLYHYRCALAPTTPLPCPALPLPHPKKQSQAHANSVPDHNKDDNLINSTYMFNCRMKEE